MGRALRGIAILVLSVVLSGNVAAQIVSDFAVDNETWTAPLSTTGLTYSATGGNPNGYIQGTPFALVTGSGTLYFLFFNAPTKFLGNRNSYFDGTLRFDIQQTTTGPSIAAAEVIITNNAGISIYYYPSAPFQPSTGWTTFSLRLHDDTGFWKTADSGTAPPATEAQIRNVISDIATLAFRGSFRNSGGQVTRLDNVTMMPPVSITTHPTPVTVCDGVTATLSAAAINNPSIVYRWQFETSPGVWTDLANGGAYTDVSTGTLLINTTGNVGAGNYRCRISGFGIDDVFTNQATLTINTFSPPPTVTGASSCTPTSFTLTAAGGSPGQYLWYTVSSGGTPIAGQTNSTFTTPVLSSTTIYYVAINNGTCVSPRTPVSATLLTPPGPPLVAGASSCTASGITLTAFGAAPGQYRWYTVASGGTPIAGETNSTYTTPVISSTTIYYVAINNACEGPRSAVTATINTPPAAPTVTDGAGCAPASIVLNASGGTAGQYRWYTVSTGGTLIPGQTLSSYTTPPLTTTTTYYVSIHNGICESTRTPVVAAVSNIPAAPTVTGAISCSTASVRLTAAGGSNGQYRWFTAATGGTALAGEVNSIFTTPVLAVSTTYFAALNINGCESTRTAVTASINPPGCATNTPPVLDQSRATTQAGGTLTVDISSIVTDRDSNVDYSSLTILTQPASGAVASINAAYDLVINYSGSTFTGTEVVRIRVCDVYAACDEEDVTIEVFDDIKVYNAVSPNNDGKNDILLIDHITELPDTRENRVIVYNRWGDQVWEGMNYNNTTVAFSGKTTGNDLLPSGTYFYKIEFVRRKNAVTGFLQLNR